MIDCGHNSSTGWKPGTHLKNQGVNAIEMLAITNYDEDHVSGANDLFDKISVQWLLRNKSVSGPVMRTLKSEDGMGAGIERLVREIEQTYTGAAGTSSQPHFEGLDRKVFYNSYPAFDDENNLSMAIFFKCHGVGVMFTGDLEIAGLHQLLVQPEFRAALQDTRVYFASHHGREGGCSEEVAKHLTRVNYVIISDKGYAHETQETLPFYRKIALGGPFRDETRRVLTTRRDGLITFNFYPNTWCPS